MSVTRLACHRMPEEGDDLAQQLPDIADHAERVLVDFFTVKLLR